MFSTDSTRPIGRRAADFAAELAGLIEVGGQPADVAGSRPT